MAVAKAGDAVFAPAVSAGTRVIVREIIPGVAVGAVVLANRAPLAFGKIRTPALPMDFAFAAGFEAFGFGAQAGWHSSSLLYLGGSEFQIAELGVSTWMQPLCWASNPCGL